MCRIFAFLSMPHSHPNVVISDSDESKTSWWCHGRYIKSLVTLSPKLHHIYSLYLSYFSLQTGKISPLPFFRF